MLDRFNDISLAFNDARVEMFREFKYLGVKFGCTMSWSSHVDNLAIHVYKRIGVIRRVKHFLPHTTLMMLSNALVIPHFDYASPVWSNCSNSVYMR